MTLLSVEGLCKSFDMRGRHVCALNDVSLTLRRGETLGIAGASGSGKTTLAHILLRLSAPDSGAILFNGEDWLALSGSALRARRAQMQMVFQDVQGAFNPRATVASVLTDPLRIHDVVDKRHRVAEIVQLLDRVGLSPDLLDRPVRDLSGGQGQRLAIARALAPRPSLIVLDEAVSALDVTIREKILELLVELQRERGVACLFISHDLAVLRAVSHRIAVMEAGHIVEVGSARQMIEAPRSAAAKALVAAVPRLKPVAGLSATQG